MPHIAPVRYLRSLTVWTERIALVTLVLVIVGVVVWRYTRLRSSFLGGALNSDI
jgi:hypothetical protein